MPLQRLNVAIENGPKTKPEENRQQKDSAKLLRTWYFNEELHTRLDTGLFLEVPRRQRQDAPLAKHSSQYPPTSVREMVTFM